MDELPGHARSLLQAARDAEHAPAGAQQRVRARVLASAAVGGAHGRWWLRTPVKLALVGGAVVLLGAAGQLLRTPVAPRVPKPRVVSPAPTQPLVLLAPTPVAQPHADATVPTSSTASPSSASSSGASLLAETALLGEVSRALGDHQLLRGHALLNRYRARYPHGQLSEEANGFSLLHGCLAAQAGARERAQAYLLKSPEGMLAARIQGACTER